jgi:hypothetical protein
MRNIERKPLGVIDALSSGFALVVRRPWVLLLPIAFNLFLWLGPQINASPLFERAIALLDSSAAAANMPADAQPSLDASKEMLKSFGEDFNILDVTAIFALGVPALLGLETLPTDSPRAPWFIVKDIGTFLGLAALLALIGVFIASVYLESIARAVRRDAQARSFAPRVLKSYVSTGILVVLVAFGLIALLSPFLIGATLVSLVNPGLASFVILIGLMLALWAVLYMAYALPAIFVSGVNPLQAIWNSFTVFRFNSWSAMGLVFLIYLIQMGFSLVWQMFLGNAWGAVFNIIANAFLGSGLIAAAMLFYQDRFNRLTEVRERIRQHQRPLKGQ